MDGVKKPSERTDRTWMRTGLSSDLWRRQFYSADHDLYYADPASVQKVFGKETEQKKEVEHHAG